MKTHINITIDNAVLKQFKRACKKDGAKVSTKIESLVRDYIARFRFNILRV